MKYLFQILVLALALLIWQAFSGDLVPSVKEVVDAFFELARSGKLLLGVTDSLIRYVIGLAIGSLVAVLVGLIFGLLPIAWIPLIVLAFGIGDKPTIFIIAYAIFFPMLLLTINAVKSVPNELVLAARGFGASKMQIITGVIMPASLFSIISGLKLAASLAWINLVVGEMVGAQSGLGYLIIDARNQLRIDSVMAVIFVIGVIGIVINFIFSLIERYAGERLGR